MHNELDFLTLQLMLNYEKVDKFVISESSRTFSGKAKPLFYKNNQKQFQRYEEKILYFDVDLTTDLPVISKIPLNEDMAAWQREKKQREHIFQSLDLKPEDIVFLVDMDEIVDVSVVLERMNPDKLNYMMLNFHMFYMNLLKTTEPHTTGPCVFTCGCYEKHKSTLSPYFNVRRFIDIENDYAQIYGCGYHFERCYDLKTKLESFSHTERSSSQTLNEWNESKSTLMNGKLVPVELPEFFTKNVNPRFIYR